MHANRHRQCQAWTEAGTPAYCYRFNVHLADVPFLDGAAHFEEVSFVFKNLSRSGIPLQETVHRGATVIHRPGSLMMTSMWASFIHDLDPNTGVMN